MGITRKVRASPMYSFRSGSRDLCASLLAVKEAVVEVETTAGGAHRSSEDFVNRVVSFACWTSSERLAV